MMTTHTLSQYLRVIFRLSQEPALQSSESHTAESTHDDDGYTLQTSHTHYHFANGVHIVCEVEQEWAPTATTAGDVCPPSDITYRVLDTHGHTIEPLQKSFKNSCQMHFWIQAHHTLDHEA